MERGCERTNIYMFESILKYKCEKCGKVIERDYNASMNLANYKLA